MTTAQESTNGHCVLPPPSSVENTAEPTSADLPANQDNNQQFPASAYHLPPKRFAPRPTAYAYDDRFHRPPETEPLPDRCQFMFSDGRQCTMARSDIHPSLCFYHADREEQLFGDPSYRCETRKLDFPELFSACRDLSTAAGVNRALAQVFRLLAQRRISRQEAATFGHLAKLLLRTISLMAAESTIRSGSSSRPPAKGTNGMSFRRSTATNWSEGPLPESALADESNDLSASVPHSPRFRAPMRPPREGVIPKTSSPISASNLADRAENGRCGEDEESRAGSPTHAPARATLARLNEVARVGAQSTASVHNCPEISTYENVKLQPIQNQHLHKILTELATCSSGRTADVLFGGET